jgi:hypothetical protein
MGGHSETRLDPTDLRETDASGLDGPPTVGTFDQVDGRFTNPRSELIARPAHFLGSVLNQYYRPSTRAETAARSAARAGCEWEGCVDGSGPHSHCHGPVLW